MRLLKLATCCFVMLAGFYLALTPVANGQVGGLCHAPCNVGNTFNGYRNGPMTVDGGAYFLGPITVDGGGTFQDLVYINGNLIVDGGTTSQTLILNQWDAGIALALQSGSSISISWPTNNRLITNDTSGNLTIPAALTAGVGNSIGWGQGSGFVWSSTTNGTVLNASGGGSAQPMVQGALNRTVTSAGNSGTSETTLASYSLPASTMNVNGRGVRITSFGTYAGTVSTKTLRLKFGATELFGGSAFSTAANGGQWRLLAEVFRTGAATQIASSTGLSASAGVTTPSTSSTTPAETLSGAVTIAMTGQDSSASNGVVLTGFYVEFLP